MKLLERIINKKNYLWDTFLGVYYPKLLADKLYKRRLKTSHGINWSNPKDLNEKINYLKFNSDTTEWSRLADKYAVRDFVAAKLGGVNLVELYGVWNAAEDINFETLPESFVLKTNCGSGTVWIVKKKSKEDLEKIRKEISSSLKQTFGIIYGEPHYSKIPPKVMAEELLVERNAISSSLIDYKMWCFDGEFFGCWACYDRHGYTTKTEWHDEGWEFHPEWSIYNDHYQDGKGRLPRPKNYDDMISIAKKLSEGFPQVRVDLYNIDGKIYFGEMTFTSAGGYMNFYSQMALDKMGEMTKIK